MRNFLNIANRYLQPSNVRDKFNFSNLVSRPDEVDNPNSNPPSMDDYASVYGNTPNRLAYQEAVNQGPPIVQRGKMAKLGAILGSMGGVLGGDSLANSYSVMKDAYDAPQNRATDYYNQRTKGLASLANMEQDDIATKIKMLDSRSDRYYKDQNLGLARDASERANRETDAQIDNYKQDNERANWQTVTDELTGETYEQNRITGEIRNKKKTKQSVGEKSAEEIAKEKRELEGRLKVQGAGDAAAMARTKYSQDASTARTDATIAARAQASRDKLNQSGAKPMGPLDQGRQVRVDLAQAAASDPELKDLDISDFIDVDPATGLPVAKQSFFDTDFKKAVKTKIQGIIDNSIKNSKSRGAASSQTKSGAAYSIREVQ